MTNSMTPPNACWTSEPPSEAGWYWMADTAGTADVVELTVKEPIAPGLVRSVHPIPTAESLTELRARAEAGERLAEALALLRDDCDHPADRVSMVQAEHALAAWEAARG